jgi:hypothetical protein
MLNLPPTPPATTAQQVVETSKLNSPELDKIVSSMHEANDVPNPYDFSGLTDQLCVSQVTAFAIKTANDIVQQTRYVSTQVSGLISSHH